ncbi:MAG: hypothetical protein IJ597_07490 [Synergistaceae bacterium]|nr:hypothetical protein [Synergistaceae bacterium]
MTATLTDDARDIVKNINVPEGYEAAIIFKNDESFLAAFRELQKEMAGAAEEIGWTSDDDVVEFVMQMRHKQDENIY